MKKENEKIQLDGKDIIVALSNIEYLLISLKNIARYYYERRDSPPDKGTYNAYALETTRFIDENKITYKLAEIREILSKNFNDDLGDDDMDDMDDIERALEHLKHWEKPGD